LGTVGRAGALTMGSRVQLRACLLTRSLDAGLRHVMLDDASTLERELCKKGMKLWLPGGAWLWRRLVQGRGTCVTPSAARRMAIARAQLDDDDDDDKDDKDDNVAALSNCPGRDTGS